MAVRYTRQFKFNDRGSDVEGVGRALAAAKMLSWVRWKITPQRIRRTWGPRKQRALKRFKIKHGLIHDYRYTREAHAKLSPFFDAKGRQLMKNWHPPLSHADKHWNAMMAAMLAVHRQTRGYNYGGEHDGTITDDLPTAQFDCSSSCSYVLWKGGMFPFSHTITSGEFANWGAPGKGEMFTVYYNSGHVWIRTTHSKIWWRFDTSPYGDTKSSKNGARLRFAPRLTWGFSARHWPGM